MRKLLFFLALLPLAQAPAQTFTADTIGPAVLSRIEGHSWPRDCGVALSQLRYLSVSHYTLDGRVEQGELICNVSIAADLLSIFRQLYEARYPIERMRLIDDYGADDERSMAHNNTSCFCFRPVSGSRKLSKHAQGLAIDINPLYNPCVRGQRVEPAQGRPYCDRKACFPYKIEQGDLLHRLFVAHGFRWGGSWRTVKDYQHFEK